MLAYSSYVGALEAAARGYREVMVPLLRNAPAFVTRLRRLRGATYAGDDNAAADPRENHYYRDGAWVGPCEEIIVVGSRLPRCRHYERTSWTKAAPYGQQVWPMKGEATFILEGGKTTMGLNNAIVWAAVNPLNPGKRTMLS